MESPTEIHIPALLEQIVDSLNLRNDSICLDGTGGTGGYAEAIIAKVTHGKLIVLDLDPQVESIIVKRLSGKGDFQFFPRGFDEIEQIMQEAGIDKFDCVVLDLGLSSFALDAPHRGFSHRFQGPLDMRFNPASGGETAAHALERLSYEELAEVIAKFGEQKGAYKLAREIKKASPRTTGELAEIISKNTGVKFKDKTLSKVFQALRIFVNRELERLDKFLNLAPGVIKSGGRLAVVSYHSLEDRLVKEFLQREAKDCICPPDLPICSCGHRAAFRIITRKPIVPSAAEIAANPRARSAKLRVGERI